MSHDSLRRKYAKKMAEMRSLEEEMKRKNVLYGNGATPSMGLSQYRGGLMDFGAIVRPSSSCSVEQRKRLDELRQKKKKNPIRTQQVTPEDIELGQLESACAGPRVDDRTGLSGKGFDVDQRQIRAFGQYSDDGEMEGGMSHLHNEFRDYRSAIDHYAKADKMREEKGKRGGLRTGKYEGEGKYGPFKDEAELMRYYFDKSEQIKRDKELIILLNEVDEILRLAREPDYKITNLKDRIRSHYTMKKVDSRPSAVFLSPGRDKGKESVDDIIRRLPPHLRKEVEEDMKKIEEEFKKKGKGKRSHSSSESEGKCGGGRSARAQIVKKVMAEKGLSLIEASKYVKSHGLYSGGSRKEEITDKPAAAVRDERRMKIDQAEATLRALLMRFPLGVAKRMSEGTHGKYATEEALIRMGLMARD